MSISSARSPLFTPPPTGSTVMLFYDRCVTTRLVSENYKCGRGGIVKRVSKVKKNACISDPNDVFCSRRLLLFFSLIHSFIHLFPHSPTNFRRSFYRNRFIGMIFDGERYFDNGKVIAVSGFIHLFLWVFVVAVLASIVCIKDRSGASSNKWN